MTSLLKFFSVMSSPVILVFGIASIVGYFYIKLKMNAVQQTIIGFLHSIVKALDSSPDLDDSQEPNQKIDTYLDSLKQAVDGLSSNKNREVMKAKFEAKTEVTSHLKDLYSLKWQYNLVRSGIEIFPLLGIIGTVAAIGAGLSDSSIDSSQKIDAIVKNFGESIMATGLGLFFAIINILLNAFFEPKFEKVLNFANDINEISREAKKAVLSRPSEV
jgi:biopolymer transport protein ExbB